MPAGRNMPSANITHSQSESIAVSSSMPSTTEAVCQSRTHARGSRDQEQDQKSREADSKTPASQAQRSAMREIAKGSSPAWGCSKGPARGCLKGAGLLERISYWNRQIFCVNWGCF